MWQKSMRVLTAALFVGGLLACVATPVHADDDTFLKQLLKDPDYGKLNKFVADEVGPSLTAQKLGIEIGTLNNLAKKAKMSEDKVLDLFKDSLKDAKRKGLSAVTALQATIGAIAFRLAQEKDKK